MTPDKARASTDAFVSPFQRLNDLLAPHAPGRAPINLTVGEPRHAVPSFVAPVLAREIDGFGRYPAIRGTDAFRRTIADWLAVRFGLADGTVDVERGILPLNGSREGLFYAALEARRRWTGTSAKPAILLPNPFYQAYAAGAVAAGCEAVMVDAGPETGFLPDLSALPEDLLARTVALYYASPANPQGAVASRADWATAIALARRHGFMLFADECYSEIYREGRRPDGVLAAAAETGSLDRVVAFNSLSKRSNLPGLRCGFAAGDPDFLARWVAFRNMAAPQVPGPIQAVAVAAFSDEAHVAENRRLYDAKFAAATRILGRRWSYETPAGGFFLWLDVAALGGGEVVAERLWREAGVRTIPGGYLSATGAEGTNPGDPYLRIAMVESLALTEEALARIVETLG